MAFWWNVTPGAVEKWGREGTIKVYRTPGGYPRYWPQDRLDDEPQEDTE